MDKNDNVELWHDLLRGRNPINDHCRAYLESRAEEDATHNAHDPGDEDPNAWS